MNEKVYFAGSIRGGREDAARYRYLIAVLGRTCRVLTEHVGDLSRSALEQGDDNDGRIYAQDTDWIRACDLLIAECTTPSLGVGYELAYAERLGKPCWVLYRPSRGRLSAMIAGDPYFRLLPYETDREAADALERCLAQLRAGPEPGDG